MPVYKYKGYNAISGAFVKGRIESDSLKSAKSKLKSTNKVIASEIKEESSSEKIKKGGLFATKVTSKEMSVMTKQFATLQSAHVPLDESLKALAGQVENPVLRNTLSQIKDLVSEGRSLGDAMSQYPNIFNKLYINMIKAGEASGSLALVFSRLSDFIEYQVKIKGQIMSAMSYPLVMILASGSIIIYLFTNLVPQLQKTFEDMKVDLPWYTNLIISLSEFVQNRWYVGILGFALIYFLFNQWKNTKKGKKKFHQILLKMPVYGSILLKTNVSKFTKTLSTLLNSGVPIIKALEITKNIVDNIVIEEVVEKAKISVQEGDSFGSNIASSKIFPSLVSNMILTGEKTGQLEEMLEHVSKAYDIEVEQTIDSMISIIEPLMIIFMAGMIGGVVIALLVPMLSIMNEIK